MAGTMKRNLNAAICGVAALTLGGLGCGGVNLGSVILPTDCFTEDVVETGCFTETTFVTVCEDVCVEDVFGFVDCFTECFDEPIVEVFCEDILVDSYLVCE